MTTNARAATSSRRARKGQIIAMGGGGFSMEPDNPLLDEYVLAQARGSKPRICFVGTASGDSARYIERFYAAFSQQSCEPTHINLFDTPPPDVAEIVAKQDVFYVGGGSTRNLIVIWREWRLDTLLERAWTRGAVMCGLSAGSLCWFENGVSDSYSKQLRPVRCLGWLTGSHCPHYDGEIMRRPAYHQMIKSGDLPPGYAADDGAALHFVGRRLHRLVSSRPDARVYRVTLERGVVVERSLETSFLGRVR
ncbi:MAG TPA: peptidase E [Gemmatimonadaceae bacterium]|jgi:peptidase E|nr:peptidase E [Gemmatimonadaceae bacterium]